MWTGLDPITGLAIRRNRYFPIVDGDNDAARLQAEEFRKSLEGTVTADDKRQKPKSHVPGVSWQRFSWVATWTDAGRKKQQWFSVQKYGIDNALRLAIDARNKGIESKAEIVETEEKCKHKSPMTGVAYKPGPRFWQASMNVQGRRIACTFSVNKYGFAEARQLAIEARIRMSETYSMTDDPIPEGIIKTDIPGVFFRPMSSAWIVRLWVNKRRFGWSFSAKKYGFRRAFEKAKERSGIDGDIIIENDAKE